MEIKLTKGKTTIIDDIDAELADHKWCYHHTGYALRAKKNYRKLSPGVPKYLYLHRVIMERMGYIPENTDHINGDGLDNRRCNLRPATAAQNSHNSGPVSGKFKGVNWRKDTKKWRARITTNNKRYHLGYYDSEEDAALAYNEAALKYHKEFAYLNEIGA